MRYLVRGKREKEKNPLILFSVRYLFSSLSPWKKTVRKKKEIGILETEGIDWGFAGLWSSFSKKIFLLFYPLQYVGHFGSLDVFFFCCRLRQGLLFHPILLKKGPLGQKRKEKKEKEVTFGRVGVVSKQQYLCPKNKEGGWLWGWGLERKEGSYMLGDCGKKKGKGRFPGGNLWCRTRGAPTKLGKKYTVVLFSNEIVKIDSKKFLL